MNCKHCGKLTSEQYCSEYCFKTATKRPRPPITFHAPKKRKTIQELKSTSKQFT